MSLRDWSILRQLSPDFFATIRMAFVFGGDALLLTSDGKLYGIGSNVLGCLGLGDAVSRLLPTEVPDLSNKNIEGLACGGDPKSTLFLLAYSNSGNIYQWGNIPHSSNYAYSYGPTSIMKPQIIGSSLKIKVQTVACGSAHFMILSSDGRVFTWGRNGNGQLGYGENMTFNQYYQQNGSYEPRQVKGIIEGKTVVEISSGALFSVALLDTGKVVTWGDNTVGQLGVNNQSSNSVSPVEVAALDKIAIKKVACGASHVLALGKTNVLYVWGDNSSSQLGFTSADASKRILSPSVLEKFRAVYLLDGLRLTAAAVVPITSTWDWKSINVILHQFIYRCIDIGAAYVSNLSVAQLETQEIYFWGKISTGQIITQPTDSQCESIDQVFAHFVSPNMMRKPQRNILEAKRRTSVSQTLANEFGNPDTSDLTIVVEKKEIHVHQWILKIRSEYFKTMLARWVKKDEKAIPIKKKSYNVIYTYLKYLYTDKLEVDLDNAVELLLLADEYGDDDFKSICEKSIKRDIKADKVAEILAIIRKIKSGQDLYRFCLDYAINHATEVITSPGFKKWDLDTMGAVFVAYVKKQEYH